MANTSYDITDKPCIICLEPDDTIDINEISINEIKPATALIKTCACKFYTHEKCIVKWITNNPTCPYCKETLCFKCCMIDVPATVTVTDLDTHTNDNSLCISRWFLLIIVVVIVIILLDKILLM